MDNRVAKRPLLDLSNDIDPVASIGADHAAKRPPFVFLFNDDILIEILSWVPTKSLIRFRCVCKSWCDLFSSPKFVVKQLSRTSSIRLLLSTKPPAGLGEVASNNPKQYSLDYSASSLFFDDDNNIVRCFRKHDFSEIFPKNCINVVGSCNGLICLLGNPNYCYSPNFNSVLWNPCTRETYMLPEFTRVYWLPKFYGFGYDSTMQAYKVVVGGHAKIAAVYSTKTGSWRTLDIPDYIQRALGICSRQGVLLNGALHWLYFICDEDRTKTLSIKSFDLAKEIFEDDIVPLPNILRNQSASCFLEIGTVSNCLVIFLWSYNDDYCRVPITIWMMKEYGVEESWTKLKIPWSWRALPKGFRWGSVFFISIIDNSLILMKLKKRKKTLMKLKKYLVLYDPNTGGFKTLSMISPELSYSDMWQATRYVETLVSPVADV